MKNSALRVGIIGAGNNTLARHIPGFQSQEGVELHAVCNRSETSGQKVAKSFGIPVVYTDWRELIADKNVDAVMIGTWPNLHAEASIAALEAGKHVLTEARMAASLKQAEAMLETSRKHPELVAQVVPAPMTLEFDSTLIRLLKECQVGRINEMHVVCTGAPYASPQAPFTWRQDFELSGVNTLMMGIYHEILGRWLGLEPDWVIADAGIHTSIRKEMNTGAECEVKIPESLTVIARFPMDIRCTYIFSGVESGLPRNEFRINGSKGSLRLDLVKGILCRSDAGQVEEYPIRIPVQERRGWRVEEDFINSIRMKTPVRLTDFASGLRYMRFTDAVWKSWTSGGEKVYLNTGE